MNGHFDCIIIGAGPAGMEAACVAQACGLETALLDEQATPGGQLYRNIESPLTRKLTDPVEMREGLALLQSFRASGTEYLPNSIVWGLETGSVSFMRNKQAECLTSSHIILAPGGMERPVPFPGWTLPGVMGAGGADILLRSGGSLHADSNAPVVLAGNGPLLLLLAGHLLEHGVNIVAWLDTGNLVRRLPACPLFLASLTDAPYMLKGLRMAWNIVRGKIPIIRNVTDIRALGTHALEGVRFRAGKEEREMPARTLLRHEGIIPRTQILGSLEAPLHWDRVQRYFYPQADKDGRTGIKGVSVAGDGAFVYGGDISRLKGKLAGIDAAKQLCVLSKAEADFRAAPIRRELRRLNAARSWLRHLFAPDPAIFNVPDETLVCRCECVTAGAIRQAVAEGFGEVNEIKRFTRCGMGHCQGRMCGPALTEIAAAAQSLSPEKVGCLQSRQPFRPVRLDAYCALHGADNAS